uniref:Uncharacterized protein n=1 Tax=Anguilla anguilla TaxID=7936 RepID=A0A0E9TM78_ANGAN
MLLPLFFSLDFSSLKVVFFELNRCVTDSPFLLSCCCCGCYLLYL